LFFFFYFFFLSIIDLKVDEQCHIKLMGWKQSEIFFFFFF